MNCKAASELMMKHLDGNLNDVEAARLKQHMEGCLKCMQEYRELDTALKALEADSMHEPPQDFGLQVMNRIMGSGTNLSGANVPEADKHEVNMHETDGHEAPRMMKALYLSGALAFMVLSSLFTLRLEQFDMPGAVLGMLELLEPVWGVAGTLFGVMEIAATAVHSVAESVIQIALVLAKHYYYVVVMLLSILFAIQWTLVGFIRRSRGGTE